MRSSSSPTDRGAPAISMILPPSFPMSVSKKVTAWSRTASCTRRISSFRTSHTPSGPDRSRSSSVPENSMKAMATRRCSASP